MLIEQNVLRIKKVGGGASSVFQSAPISPVRASTHVWCLIFMFGDMDFAAAIQVTPLDYLALEAKGLSLLGLIKL